MFKMIRGAGLIGGIAAFARSPMGQRAFAQAKAYVAKPENRQKLEQLRSKAMPSRTRTTVVAGASETPLVTQTTPTPYPASN